MNAGEQGSKRRAATVTCAPLAQHRKDAELEAWIVKTLRLRDLFAGVTSTEIRRDRLKALLLERGLTHSHAGKRGGKPVTWSQLFEQLYGEAL